MENEDLLVFDEVRFMGHKALSSVGRSLGDLPVRGYKRACGICECGSWVGQIKNKRRERG